MLFYPRCWAQLLVVLDGRGAADSSPRLIEGPPRDAVVMRNGYHEADTWSLTFDARKLPIDPDAIRGLAATIYMYGATGKDDQSDPAVSGREMVRGLADDPELALSEDGQTFSVSGRDYTGILLDAEWDPKVKIACGRPLDETVQQIADSAAPPGTLARFKVVWQVSMFEQLAGKQMRDDGPPIVGEKYRATKKKGLVVKPGKNVWDVIYDLVLSHGFIVFVKGDRIIITDPRTQTSLSATKAPQLVYGRNLQSLKMSRKLAKEKIPQVRVTAFDPVAGEIVSVVYPPRGDVVTTGLGLKKDEQIFLPGPKGITDKDALLRYAQCRFANMARAEAEYEATTKHLRSLDGQDLFQLDAGMPVIFGFDPFNAEQMRALSPAQRLRSLRAQGFDRDVAELVAERFDRIDQLRQVHYTRTAEFHYSQDDGIAVNVTGINYAYEPREVARTLFSQLKAGA